MPGLFTCPLVLKSPPPSSGTSEPASTEAASKHSSTPKPLPISMREKSKSIGRNEAEQSAGDVMIPAKSAADEEQLTKDDSESGEDSANDGYACR